MLMPGHPDVVLEEHVWDIILADESTWSEREKHIVQNLVDHGELYWVDCCESSASFTYTTDLANPVRLETPKWVSKRQALRALTQAVFTMGN